MSAPSAEKYRHIADWIDTMTKVCVRYIELLGPDRPDYEDAMAALAGTEVQDDLRRWADEMDAATAESERQTELRTMMRDVAAKVAKDYKPAGFISTAPPAGRWSPRRDAVEFETPFTIRQDLRALVKERIARGMMPQNLDQLTESRGTVETAAADLAAFTGYPLDACLDVIQEVYP